MTGFNTGNLALSTVTIASLEDIGYVVDYSQADSYTAADMGGCVCNNLQQGNTKKSVAKLGGIIPSTTTSVEVDDKETEKEEEDTTANNKLGGKITLKRPTGVVKPQTEEVEEVESEEVVEESEEEEQEAASATTKKIGGFKLGGRPTGTRGAIPKTTGRVGKIGRVGGGRSRHHRQLSNDGLRIATDYGKKALRANKVKRDKMPYSDQHRYIGDLVVIVLYIENDEIYTVDVWNTDL